ncbi:MAG: DUF6514 family protein [Erysipelotrichaceae bacterium]
MYLYCAYKEMLFSPYIGEYVSFGIEVIFVSPKGRKEILKFSDVSPNETKVERLAELCTKEQLEPNQLCSVIEDYIY